MKKTGRKKLLTNIQIESLKKNYHIFSIKEWAELYKVSEITIYRCLHDLNKK